MIRPGISKYDWEVELSDSKSRKRYGLKVPQGSLQIGTVSQDDTVYVRNVGKRVGDFDEQRSWKGGRGMENLSENAEAFYDSQNAWTLTPGHVHQSLQWFHGRGLRSEAVFMPTPSSGRVQFRPLLGSALYISNSFVASTFPADKAYLWIRRRGTPSTLTFVLASDSSGSPSTAIKTVTKTVSDVTDYISLYEVFDWTGTQNLTNGVTYWVYVYGDTTDNKDNHWEVGVNPDVSSGKTSSDGSTWESASFAMYYRVVPVDTAVRWFRFYLREAMYVISRVWGGNSTLYINGDRGIASNGTSTTLIDSSKSWVTDRWANAWVRIIYGTGSTNLPMKILSNTSTTLTLDGTWTGPSTDSQYIIYATEWFTQITLTGGSLSTCYSEPAVVNNVAYIPQGPTGIAHLEWNTTTKAHNLSVESASGTNGLADFLMVSNDPADGPVIWRANNRSGTGSGGLATVSRANLLSSGAFIAYNTALTFKTGIFTGSTSFFIRGMGKKDNQIYVFREDGMGVVSNDRFNTIETGVEKTPDRINGSFNIAHGQFFYYSWLHSIVRIYGSSHDDIGDDYRSIGLPDGREGEYIDGDTYLKLLFVAIDSGANGHSSVLAWDGLGWHEMVRSRRIGDRIQFCKVQTNAGTRNRLWTQMGPDLTFQELPYKKASPRLDSGARFMHEAVIESAAIDMGTASAMPKLIKDLTATIKNLNANGREIYLDIQTDDDVHTTNWTQLGLMTQSPESVVFLGINCNRFAYRLRICCDDNTVPVDVEGVVPNGYARTPYKMIFTMTIQAGGIFSRRGKLSTAGELMRWLLDQSRIAGYVNMSSVYEMAHNWKVVVHPPRQFPMVPRKGRNPESASITITLQEV